MVVCDGFRLVWVGGLQISLGRSWVADESWWASRPWGRGGRGAVEL